VTRVGLAEEGSLDEVIFGRRWNVGLIGPAVLGLTDLILRTSEL